MLTGDFDKFLALVERYPQLADFVGPRDSDLVEAAEQALGLSFPPAYRRFVSELGAGNMASEEFYGVINGDFTSPGVPDGIWVTLDSRTHAGLPESMIVVGVDGMGGSYVIDVAKAGVSGEPPVEVWLSGRSKPGDELEQVAADFGAFLLLFATESIGPELGD